ncbi:MAG TPA: hypothetical protein DCR15_15170 [Arthrobacter bacterium]|nr:hypothetical protein [Arthrobacter sp.]
MAEDDLESAFAEYADESLKIAKEWEPLWLGRWAPSACVCMQAWSSVTGRTCPVHGHIAPMQVTC